MKTSTYDDDIILSWECLNPDAEVAVYAAAENRYREGGKDEWVKLATVKASDRSFRVEGKRLPQSKFYKFVLAAPNNHLNRWVKK